MDNAQTVAGERKANVVVSQDMSVLFQQRDKEITLPITNEAASNREDANGKEIQNNGAGNNTSGTDENRNDEETKEHTEEISKTSPKLQERFSKLTNDRKAAQEAARNAEERAARAEEALRQSQAEETRLKQKYEPPKTDIGPKPLRDQFVSDADHEKALEDWTRDKVVLDLKKEADAKAAKEHSEAVNKAWSEQISSAIKDIGDFQEIVGKSNIPMSQEAQFAIMEADNGALIIYHLAKNPELAEKLNKMSIPAMNREIGKLSAKLEKPAPKQTQTQTLADTMKAEISKAPKPITPAGGAPDGVVSYDTSKMDYQTYKQMRASGKIK